MEAFINRILEAIAYEVEYYLAYHTGVMLNDEDYNKIRERVFLRLAKEWQQEFSKEGESHPDCARCKDRIALIEKLKLIFT